MYAYCAGSPGTFGLTAVAPGTPLTEFDKAGAAVQAQIDKAGPAEAAYLRRAFQPGAATPTIRWAPLAAAGVFAVGLLWFMRRKR